jgi:hypothetical protein
MQEDKIRKAQAQRLGTARKAAGYTSARSAAIECGWPESSYRSHENGSRKIGDDDARKYIARFQADGAKGFTAQWVIFGPDDDTDQSLDEMLKDQPLDLRKKAYRAVRAVLRERS